MQTVVVTPPESEPVTVEEAKRHAQIPLDLADDDALIAGLIRAAREYVEGLTGRAFVTQTLETTWDDFPRCGGIIRLPRAPVVEVVSVGYLDSADQSAVMDPSGYRAVIGTPGRLLLPYSGVGAWPSHTLSPTVRYVAGYGDASAVPETAKLCISMLAAHWYERRLPVAPGAVGEVPFAVKALMGQLSWGNYP
jgi:uncharacterized phiE125 gp8 family phage protein